MKQTSIEWLVEQIKSDQNQKALSESQWMEVIKQAKARHYREIMYAYEYGKLSGINSSQGIDVLSANEYYDSNFNSNV